MVARSTDAVGSFDVQLTGAIGGAVSNIQEFPLSLPVTLAPNQEARFVIDPLVNVYWLFVKTILNSGAPQFYWDVTAYD